MGLAGKAESVLKKHFLEKMPKRVRELTNAAKMDLNFGPHSKEDFRQEGIKWPGYEKACSQIQDWADDNIGECWVDMDAEYVMDSEPEGYEDEETGEWQEPFLENTYHFDRRDAMRAVFGDLVGNGID